MTFGPDPNRKLHFHTAERVVSGYGGPGPTHSAGEAPTSRLGGRN